MHLSHGGFLTIASLVTYFTFTVSATTPKTPFHTTHSPIPNQYIVVLKPHTNYDIFSPKFDSMTRTHNARPRPGQVISKFKHQYNHGGALNGFTIQASNTTLQQLLSMDQDIDYIEQDSVFKISTSQNNAPSWGLPRVSSTAHLNSTTILAGKGLPKFFYNSSQGSNVTVYVIDTGINTSHQDFGGRATMAPTSFVSSTGPNVDDNGHGTHVSGIIGGTSFGVAKKVLLKGLKAMDANGAGTTSGIIAAMDWVIANHKKGSKAVVNMSLSGGKSVAMDSAADRLYQAGIPLVVAAGNIATVDACDSSPAGAANAFTVGATDVTDTFAYYSSFGSCIKILAPGSSITSTYIGSKNATKTLSGTSMSAPHVAGVAALYLSSDTKGSLNTPQKVYNKLVATSVKGVIKGSLKGTVNAMVYDGATK